MERERERGRERRDRGSEGGMRKRTKKSGRGNETGGERGR